MKDYLDMGVGIEARYGRCKRFWAPHLRLCKEFVCEPMPTAIKGLAILGAGRLLDIDWKATAGRFQSVSLFDLDPSCEPVWRNFRRMMTPREVTFHTCDITGVADHWTEALRRTVCSPKRPALAELCAFFAALTPPVPELPGFDRGEISTVYSLNLLSQLPIYLRDRWLTVLADMVPYALRPDGEPVAELKATIDGALGRLQAAHLTLLSTLGADTLYVITDRSFLYYRSTETEWQEEPALYANLELSIAGYREVRSDAWFWHIAPQGIEETAYGVIHDVVAKAFVRSVP